MTVPIRCVGLLSGGLDSTLATRWMLDQGFDVVCINFRSPFCTCTAKGATCSAAVAAARSAGDVPLEVQTIGARFLFTGEVLGHRPMSQHRQAMLGIVDRHGGLEGLILRPLSAQQLPGIYSA